MRRAPPAHRVKHFTGTFVRHPLAMAAVKEVLGDFLTRHRPGDVMAPSQAPGVISSKAEGGLVA